MSNQTIGFFVAAGLVLGFTALVAVNQANFQAREALYRECLEVNRQAIQASAQKGSTLYSSSILRCDLP